MPPTQTDEGLRAAKEIRDKHPETAVLVLSQYVEEGYALELLQESAEGVGYLLKDRVYDLADFVAAVKRVARAALRSIRAWCRSWSAGDGAAIRSTT